MKKFIVAIVFLFVGVAVFAQIPLFFMVDMNGDSWAEEVFVEALIKNLSRTDVFMPADDLDHSTVEILVKGLPTYYDPSDGPRFHVYYTYSVAVIFHDERAVRQSNNTVLVSYTDEESITWAANQSYNYLRNAVNYILQNGSEDMLIPSGEEEDDSGWSPRS